MFFRVFLWFWVAMVVVVGVVVISSPFLTQNRPRLARWEQHAEERALGFVERVARDIEIDGVEALEQGPERQDRRGGRGMPMRLQVFDATGAERTGRGADVDAQRLAESALDSWESVTQRVGSQHLIAYPVTEANGESLVLVGIMRRPPGLTDLLEPKILLPRIGLLAAVAGLFVLWLAYQISSPLSALRSVTRKLASGDLGARVGDPISRRKDEIGQLAVDFDSMAEQIESQVESQRRLLQDVSHELRSPLARLSVALELARRDVPENAQDTMDRIERECERLNELIAHLLDLSRQDGSLAGGKKLDLETLLEEVVEDARFEVGEGAVKLSNFGPNGATVLGSADLLRSAFENVLRNAVSFTDSETVVEVDLAVEHREAVVKVSDRGPGVPEKDLERIFKPFFRVEQARDRRQGGTGLGLAIAERAVSRHGGRVSAHNRTDGGLVVEIRLPLTVG